MPLASNNNESRRNVIGERLRTARLKSTPPLTQDQLSGKLAATGVQLDRVAITKIENGVRCVFDYEVRAFANVLRIDVAWLLGLSGADAAPRQKPATGKTRRTTRNDARLAAGRVTTGGADFPMMWSAAGIWPIRFRPSELFERTFCPH